MRRSTTAVFILVIAFIVLGALYLQNKAEQTEAIQPQNPPISLQDSSFESAVYTFAGDTFTLSNGQASIQGHADWSPDNPELASSTSPTAQLLIPLEYTFATSSSGDSSGTGQQGGAAALYRSYGANIVLPTLFVFSNANGIPQQMAATSIDQEDASIQSVSVNGGVITLNLLVVSPQDQQNLPHYEWKANQPVSLDFRIINGQLVQIAPTEQEDTN